MMKLCGTGVAAVLCLLAAAPHAAHAQACDDGFVAVSDTCRPCGGEGEFPCPEGQTAPGCGEGLALNLNGRCRPCGDFAEPVCIGPDGESFCTGDRVIPGPERCERCGSFGTPPCDDEEEPCDSPELFPAADDNNICRPCGATGRACCPPETGLSPCRFDFQECVDGFCLRCGDVPDADPTCPDFTPTPPAEPMPPLDPSECPEGTTPNSRGGCSACGEFAQLVCVGDDGSRFCTGDRVIVGPERCDRCGSFGTPPCEDEEEPCEAPELFPAPDDNNICRPCGARLRACCPPETGLSPCRFDFQDCVDGFCLRCDGSNSDPGCPGVLVEEPAVGPSEPVVPEPTPAMPDMMMASMGPVDGPAEGSEDAYEYMEAPAEGPAMAPM